MSQRVQHKQEPDVLNLTDMNNYNMLGLLDASMARGHPSAIGSNRQFPQNPAGLARNPYTTMTFDQDYAHLASITQMLSMSNNAYYVREIRLSFRTLFSEINLDALDQGQRIQDDYLIFSSNSLRDHLFRLFSSCTNLEAIHLEGFMEEDLSVQEWDRNKHYKIEKAFIDCVIDGLCAVRLPKLAGLSFKIRELSYLSRLWSIYNNNNNDRSFFTQNVSPLKVICFNNPWRTKNGQTTGYVEQFTDWVAQFRLQHFAFTPDHGNRNDLYIAPLGPCFSSLRSLQLKKVDIIGSFSNVLRKLDLERVSLKYVTVPVTYDRWQHVFEAVDSMPFLRWIEMKALRYDEPVKSCIRQGMCSHLIQDRQAYLKLQPRVYALADAGLMERHYFRAICYCIDESQGIYINRVFVDNEKDEEDHEIEIEEDLEA